EEESRQGLAARPHERPERRRLIAAELAIGGVEQATRRAGQMQRDLRNERHGKQGGRQHPAILSRGYDNPRRNIGRAWDGLDRPRRRGGASAERWIIAAGRPHPSGGRTAGSTPAHTR